MKVFFKKTISLIVILTAAATVGGCATGQTQPQTQEEHKAHHPEGAAVQQPSGMGQGGNMGMAGHGGQGGGMGMMGQGGGQMGMMGKSGTAGQMDLKSMCEMHDRMKSAKTSGERSAMIDDHMKNMPPEMRQRHMEMMQQHCK